MAKKTAPRRYFDNAGTAIATARRIANANHEVIATQQSPSQFRVYVDRETYNTTGTVLWTNLWDINQQPAA